MVVIDTSVIVDHLRQLGKITFFRKLEKELHNEALTISIITIQELYAGRSTRDHDRERMLLATISPLEILPYTYETAELAGKLIRDAKNSLQFVDAAIAATAVVNGAALATLNKKDFEDILDLELV